MEKNPNQSFYVEKGSLQFKKLRHKGHCTIVGWPSTMQAPELDGDIHFRFSMTNTMAEKPEDKKSVWILWLHISKGKARLYLKEAITQDQNLEPQVHELLVKEDTKLRDFGVSSDHNCRYWVSLDSTNQILRYGKGEHRLEFQLFAYHFKKNQDKVKEYLPNLLNDFTHYDVYGLHRSAQLEDPVYSYFPPVILDKDKFTMEAAANNQAICIENLTPEANYLYGTIAGEKFTLETSGFEHLREAIDHSWANDGWVAKKAKEKDHGDPLETYLRITLGDNNTDSPGINYVMEIWPPGHYSPVHEHGNSYAIIKVLTGSVHAEFYRWLSKTEKPKLEVDFNDGQVTYITPQLNQTHRLHNIGKKCCVTIQCYRFGDDNRVMRENFDYLDEKERRIHYVPEKDMDFRDFVKLMKEEYTKKEHVHLTKSGAPEASSNDGWKSGHGWDKMPATSDDEC